MDDFSAAPSKVPWPPVIMAGAVLLALILSWLVPIPLSPETVEAFRGLGVVFILLGLGLDIWTFQTFRRHATTVRPDRSAAALATDGPFRYSRNPIYIGNGLLILGLGLAFANLWLVLLTPAVFVLLDRVAIAREEKHLEARFGEEYRAFKARVRRWI
ncbi:methyltransferase family protein [Afifella pfennigii]|uniref:methyltransferase family protein n=1 Tax=Afifella pfennigii TaxID=209897 RepID=UPI00047BE80A|nr:isoprenylcysteine carboxylmethyltransferase family protein [Afifella pfennigii]